MITDAKWISTGERLGAVCPEFRKKVSVRQGLKKASISISAVGVYTLYLNGKRVGDQLMTPGLTSYSTRIQYQTYDLTEMLAESNTVAVRVGNGWALSEVYKKYVHPADKKYQKRIIAELTLEYADGETERIHTDDSWEVFSSPVTFSELYHGETVDMTAEIASFGMAEIDNEFSVALVPQESGYVREMVRVAPRELIVTPKGERVIDFGQNLAGYVEIRYKGKKGDRIVLSHAEVLDKNGNFYNANYRSARNIVTYVLGDEGEAVFKPQTTFQGYRYVRLDEYPSETVDLGSFTSVAIFTDMRRTGYFRCGDPRIEQLYSNVLWGQRSNFIDIPTDCPQRDERFGWTGDAQVFCRTAAINYDVESFFCKWLEDMAIEQDSDGGIWGIVPALPPYGQAKGCGWGDAAAICPWEIYRAYGNRDVLRRFYPMMKKWVEYIHNTGEDEYLWIGGFHWGDWLAMDAGEGIMFGATQTDLIASAFFAYSAEICLKTAEILGEKKDAEYYKELLSNIRSAFRKAFIKDGMPTVYPKGDAFSTNRPVKAMTQTALALILRFGLCAEEERAPMADKLVELIRENDGRMTTGFLGTANILHALSENGRADAAFDLLFQEKAPSWLFSVDHGATTMWEHWDSLKEDGEFWDTKMNSFNHYAYGAVYDWIFGCVGGIDVLDGGAGYRHISVEPHTDKRLGYAYCSVDVKGRGTLSSAWRYLDDGRVRFEFVIPNGTTAEVKLPSGRDHTLGGGEYVFTE